MIDDIFRMHVTPTLAVSHRWLSGETGVMRVATEICKICLREMFRMHVRFMELVQHVQCVWVVV